MHRLPKRLMVAAALAALALVGAFGAYAYWSTSGSGSGSADAASSNGTVTLHPTFSAGIFPGGTKTVTFTADNAGSTNLFVGTISLDSVTFDGAHSSCSAADFSMPNVTSNSVVAAGASGQSIAGTGTLTFANTSANQNPCKGATITLVVSST